MRGIAYRLGRRRAGSVLLAVGAALTLAPLVPGSAAAAVAGSSGDRAHGLSPVPGHTTVVRSSADTHPQAHAAGHKIA